MVASLDDTPVNIGQIVRRNLLILLVGESVAVPAGVRLFAVPEHRWNDDDAGAIAMGTHYALFTHVVPLVLVPSGAHHAYYHHTPGRLRNIVLDVYQKRHVCTLRDSVDTPRGPAQPILPTSREVRGALTYQIRYTSGPTSSYPRKLKWGYAGMGLRTLVHARKRKGYVMESTEVCKSCNGTGIMSAGTEWEQFCPDCITGNALALKACGSTLDPTKYPACHYDIDEPGCNDQGVFPDGSSCDCEKQDIVSFESSGLSHEDTIKLMCVLVDNEYDIIEEQRPALEQIWALQDEGIESPNFAQRMSKLLQENPGLVQESLDHNWLRRFL